MRKRVPSISELFDLSGRTALVTGGGLGIGRQIAQGLMESGAEVIITSRELRKAKQSAGELSRLTGGTAAGLALDVCDPKNIALVFEELAGRYGRLDILVNNAGGAPKSRYYNIWNRSPEDWNLVIRTNLTGLFLCTQSALRLMMPARKGSIINIASIAGMVGRNRRMYRGVDMRPNTVDYAACKAGIIGFTRDAAAELGPYGIRVNAISPGGVQRSHDPRFVRRYAQATALGRMGIEGLDIKGAAVLLAGDAGGYITGANIVVDGGFVVFK